MTKPISMSGQIRKMIDRGCTNKTIIEKLGVKPQIVYNIRHKMNRDRGLGAIAPKAAPRTGINKPVAHKTAPAPTAPTAPPAPITYTSAISATPVNPEQPEWMYEPEPEVEPGPQLTFLQRVIRWFRG